MTDPDWDTIRQRVMIRHSKSLEYLHKVEKEEQMVDLDADAHQYRLDEIKKLEKEYADLRKIFDDTVGKLVSEKIAREITYATEIEQLTERNKQLEAALRECANQHRAIWSLAVKDQKGETTLSPYALAQITWSANEAARAEFESARAALGEKDNVAED